MISNRCDVTTYNTVVIGAGPSGLAASFCLKEKNIPYVILEGSKRVASSWQYVWEDFELAQRVDELSMVGLNLTGKFPAEHHLKRDEIIKVFEGYAEDHELNIKFDIKASVVKKDEFGIFQIETNQGCFTAENVIFGIGARQQPKYPECVEIDFIENNKDKIMHGAWYQGPKQFSENANILVVGSGLSALTITDNLVNQKNVNYTVNIACAYNDTQIKENNKHLLSYSISMSSLENKGVKNFGKLEHLEKKENFLRFSKSKEDVRLDDFDKVIFCTGYTTSYDILDKIIDGEAKRFLDSPTLHREGVTEEPGIYLVGVPNKGERTVTINKGSQEAENVVNHIANLRLQKLSLPLLDNKKINWILPFENKKQNRMDKKKLSRSLSAGSFFGNSHKQGESPIEKNILNHGGITSTISNNRN